MKKLVVFVLMMIVLLGCSNESNESSDSTTSVQFRNLDVTVEANVTMLDGEVQATSREFYYVVLLGEEQVSEENKISVESQSWSEFSLEFPVTDEIIRSEDVPVFQLYGKTNGGEVVNPNYVPIDVE